MKKLYKHSIVAALAVSFALGIAGPMAVLAAGPAAVNLGSAGNFVILAKTGVSTTGSTSVVGDIGASPAAASYITGFALNLPAYGTFSTSALVTGKVYGSDYAVPTPTTLTTAVGDMQAAYTDGMGRAATVTELGAGNIAGLTLVPGVYKWGTGVTIPTDVTLAGAANDVWIFQVAQNLSVSSGVHIVLSGGAQASNVFWVVAGQTTIGTTAVFNGNVLDQTAIVLNTGARLNGRALAQTAVTLDANAVMMPTFVAATSVPPPTVVPSTVTCSATQHSCVCVTGNYCLSAGAMCISPTSACPAATPVTNVPTGVVCAMDVMQCSGGTYVSRQGPTCAFAACPVVTSQTQTQTNTQTNTQTPPASDNAALQTQLNGLLATLHSLQTQAAAQSSSVRAIATNLQVGSRADNVMVLQQFLTAQNKGPAARALANAGATAYFGGLTRAALAEFQANVGISPASGIFGPITRAYISMHY